MTPIEPSLAIHGGAGIMPAAAMDQAMVDAYHAGSHAALAAGGGVIERLPSP